MEIYFLIAAFFLIALVYSSVGFGGGSSYLALMALLAVSFEVLRPTALLCNIVVVTGGSILFFKEGLLDLRKSWPLFAVSVPMAFLGGYFPVRQHTFFLLLALALIVASLLLWFQDSFQKNSKPEPIKNNLAGKLGLGGAIGFLSGMVSIGGGIFLSPVLHLLRWEEPKRISALASFFILVNSVGGLAGQLSRNPNLDWEFIAPLLLAVLAGGQIGSRVGVKWFNAIYIKRITALLIFVAGLNILKDHW
ncbi:MAG: sulfite exporter TauE/SafE family protein [Bacteroidetes bacterium]|nr:sulfite exporter TauE/SafE family protein [Bacteroidota bacterium]